MNQISEHKRSRLAILLLFIFIISFFTMPHIKAAKTDENDSYTFSIRKDYNIDVTISYGFESNAKYGRYMGIRIHMTNHLDEFIGRIDVMAPKQENNTKYGKEIVIKKDETKEYFLTLPVTDDTGILQVKILDEKNKVQLEEYFHINIGNYVHETYIGLLSDRIEELSYMDSIGTRVFYLDEFTMPEDYLGLDLLDVIVINDFDTKRLSSNQLKALDKWVMNGGTLVLGTGESYKEVIDGLNPRFFNDSKEGFTKQDILVDDKAIDKLTETISKYLEDRRLLYENIKGRNEILLSKGLDTISMDNTGISDEAREFIGKFKVEKMTVTLAPIHLEDGRNVLVVDNQVIMEDILVGKGTIQLFRSDLSLSKDMITTGYRTVTYILEHLSESKKNQLRYEYYGDYTNYNIIGSMSYTDTNNIPNVLTYFVILILYIIIVGPVTYIILKKIDKRSLTWILVPVISILFTLVVFVVGGKTRIKSPYVGYIELLTYDKNNTVLDEVYFSLTSPNNDTYTTTVDKKYQVKELRDSSYNYHMENLNPKNKANLIKYVTSITSGFDDTIIRVEQNPAFTPIYYQAKDTYTGDNKLKADISYHGGKIMGTVYNGFEFDLKNALLISDDYIVNLDILNKGEGVNINNKDNKFISIRDEIYDDKYLAQLTGGSLDAKIQTSEVRRKSSILTYLIDNYLKGLNDSFILGFIDSKEATEDTSTNQLVKELEANMDVYGAKVIVLPVDVNYRKDNKIFYSSIDSYLNLEGESEDRYYLTKYLNADKTYEYIIPDSKEITSFEYLNSRNREIELDYMKEFKGNIYFYNYNTNAYDEVFSNNTSVTSVADYIKEDKLLVKYEPDISLNSSQVVTPNISFWKEDAYARD